MNELSSVTPRRVSVKMEEIMAETTLPKLRVSEKEARQKIEAQIEKGRQLSNQNILAPNGVEKAKTKSIKWSDYNKTLLLRLFDNTSIAEDAYTDFDDFPRVVTVSGSTPFVDKLMAYLEGMDASIKSLESIRDQLELYDEPTEILQRTSGSEGISDNSTPTFGNKVFIVHGHNNEAKETVARFVENFGIEATILHEQANRGQTIPEKFEEQASEAGFAIILLTPDDVGASQDEMTDLKPRARQNVVLELGCFWGRLGRERMCVLYKEGVELPSDIHGILYVPMDNFDGWKQKLAREMKQAGLPIDPMKLL